MPRDDILSLKAFGTSTMMADSDKAESRAQRISEEQGGPVGALRPAQKIMAKFHLHNLACRLATESVPRPGASHVVFPPRILSGLRPQSGFFSCSNLDLPRAGRRRCVLPAAF